MFDSCFQLQYKCNCAQTSKYQTCSTSSSMRSCSSLKDERQLDFNGNWSCSSLYAQKTEMPHFYIELMNQTILNYSRKRSKETNLVTLIHIDQSVIQPKHASKQHRIAICFQCKQIVCCVCVCVFECREQFDQTLMNFFASSFEEERLAMMIRG